MFGVINGGGVRTCSGSSTEVGLEHVWVISGGGVRTCLGSSTQVELDRVWGHQRECSWMYR